MTASMPWVKLYTEMLDDPKIGRLSEHLKWRFIQLILYAGELDNEGWLPECLDDAAWRLRIEIDQIQEDLEQLKNAKLVHQDRKGRWCISAFSKRQGRTQAEKQEQWRAAQERRRAHDTIPPEPDDIPPAPDETPEDVIHDTDMNHTGVIPLDKIREDKTLAPIGASENPGIVKNAGAYKALEGYEARKARGDPDVSWLPEYLRPLGEAFVSAADIYPLKTEHTRWRKDLDMFYDSAILPAVIPKAVAKMRNDGITIKTPASLFGVARDISAKGSSDRGEVFWEVH